MHRFHENTGNGKIRNITIFHQKIIFFTTGKNSCILHGRVFVMVLTLERLQIHVNVCETVQLFAGFLQCSGGKFENAEVFKGVFVVYFVFGSK